MRKILKTVKYNSYRRGIMRIQESSNTVKAMLKRELAGYFTSLALDDRGYAFVSFITSIPFEDENVLLIAAFPQGYTGP